MKNSWKLISDEEAGRIWNENLAAFEDCSPFQTFEWGQYHKALGWEPLYCAYFDEEENIRAMSMVLLKRFFLKTGFAWAPGGPVGDLEVVDEKMPKTIMATTGLKRLYLRVRSDRTRKTSETLYLEHKKWARSLHRMVSSFSMELDLDGEIESIDKNFKSSWRRQLKLSGRNELVVKQIINPDIAELHQAYSEMEATKGLAELFSKEKLENLFQHVRQNLIVFRCEDEAGQLLSFRGVLFIGHRAVEYMGVTNDRGRELRASFPLERELLRHCHQKGITKYDLGGIDPWENPGCHRFKRGTGATEVEYLGEWDWASSVWLRWFGNWAIHKRQKIKEPESNSARQTDKVASPVGRVFGSVVRTFRTISGLF
jgi:lipid II:glycine glycyltransferase (peptidoglycan interpeptide bridge formation enzyme)